MSEPAVTVAIGFWYRPAQAWQFWTSTVASQDRVGFAYVQNQSINGVFGRLQWTTWEHHLPWLIAGGVLAVAGMTAAWIAHRPTTPGSASSAACWRRSRS